METVSAEWIDAIGGQIAAEIVASYGEALAGDDLVNALALAAINGYSAGMVALTGPIAALKGALERNASQAPPPDV